MWNFKKLLIGVCLSSGVACTANATGIPTFDAAAVAQGIATVEELKNQLEQARQLHSSLNGARGLGEILNNPALRNYLPTDWRNVYDSVKNGGYDGLTTTAKVIRDANQVYDMCAKMTGAQKNACLRQSNQGAQTKDFVGQALDATGQRLTQIESLMTQINATQDPKAIGEVQARINAEQAMIQNELTKLQLFKMMAETEEKLARQQIREGSVQRTRRASLPN